MSDLLKLLLPVFLSPSNYAEMLKKLGSFVFYETWIATFILREIPEIDALFGFIEKHGAIGRVLSVIPNYEKFNLVGLAISLLIACIFYAVQMHDRISDLFGIRKRFDRNYILLPMAVFVGAQLTPAQLNSLITNRHSILRRVFYDYVSSRAATPLVDKHEIERALDAWSWYWILIEAIPVALLSALVAIMFSATLIAVSFCAAAILCWILSSLFYLRLERFTRPEIEAIIANKGARADIQEAFRAL
jgi:hypothetical protein